jgi:hypothetical protein
MFGIEPRFVVFLNTAPVGHALFLINIFSLANNENIFVKMFAIQTLSGTKWLVKCKVRFIEYVLAKVFSYSIFYYVSCEKTALYIL